MPRPNLKALSLVELEALLSGWHVPAFTARLVWQWLYEKGESDVQRMTNVPAPVRDRMAREMVIPSLEVEQVQRSRDGAVKYAFKGYGGQTFESVFLPTTKDTATREYHTVCVSTQVGCAVACPFCATGQMGFQLNLSASEMLEQVHAIERNQSVQVRNIVLMGMGEPLMNYDAVVEALARWRNLKGLSWRRLTLSTSGYRPGLERLVRDRVPVRLALSLHAPVNPLRDRLVPINRTYPLETLWPLCREYTQYSGEPLTLEYVMLGDLNDYDDQARELVRIAGMVVCKVNLIPWNPVGHSGFRPPEASRLASFVNILRRRGVRVTVRRERGMDIAAACGQLISTGAKAANEANEAKEAR